MCGEHANESFAKHHPLTTCLQTLAESSLILSDQMIDSARSIISHLWMAAGGTGFRTSKISLTGSTARGFHLFGPYGKRSRTRTLVISANASSRKRATAFENGGRD
jgi:hypothetical protein